MSVKQTLMLAFAAALFAGAMAPQLFAQDPKKVTRVDGRNPDRANGGQYPNNPNGGGRVIMDEGNPQPSYENAGEEAVSRARTASKPLVIVFFDESPTQTADNYFAGKELYDLSVAEAVFVRVTYTKDRDASPSGERNMIPVCKLATDNPTRDFRVGSYPTIIVCDCHCNEISRFTRLVTATDLQNTFKKITPTVEAAVKRLDKNLEAARKAWDNKDYGKAITAIEKNFREGLVGLAPAQDSIALFKEIRDAARNDMSSAEGEDGKKLLGKLKSAFKKIDTDFYKEIEEAIKAAK